jgi:hypothetical protein
MYESATEPCQGVGGQMALTVDATLIELPYCIPT